MASSNRFFVQLASNNGMYFSNASQYDALLYTENATQDIHIGTIPGVGSNAQVTIGSNITQFDGTMRMSNLRLNGNLTVSGIDMRAENSTFTASNSNISCIGFSNTSTGLRMSVDSNINAYSTTFTVGASATELMRLTGDGKLGIGTSNPPDALAVVGNIDATSNMYIGGDLVCGGNVSANNFFWRNRVINGDMRINQRGSFVQSVGPGTGGPFYNIDRFGLWCSVNPGTLQMSNCTLTSSDTPFNYGFTNSYRVTATAACGGYGYVFPCTQLLEGYSIEDFNWGTAYGCAATLSFWMKTNMTATSKVAIGIRNSPITYTYNTEAIVTTSGVWQYVVTIIPPPPNGSAWGTGNSLGAWLDIATYGSASTGTSNAWINANADRTTNTANLWGTINRYFEVTGIQFEKGDVATPFEFRPFPMELQLCQRYYCTSLPPNMGYGAVGGITSNNGANMYQAGNYYPVWYGVAGPIYPVQMRASPTVTIWNTWTGTSGRVGLITNGSNENSTIAVYADSGVYGVRLIAFTGTFSNTCSLYQYGYYADAELT